ncbi:pyridoxal-dependent decarboxylase [Bremerella sp. T1]|uniref:pyridoxal-dependent decarboxylase n=1 Tax=Bremerella sp. TYQ1 TaxID=3119568 RepID=UPI001CC9E3C6|nr:pyridoxal-dependent decarboxylase [Bremerella volcania]UBM36627.1 hypothetical protein LA756_01695 [Bremerella volcania]
MDQYNDNWMKPLFLGPKAENSQLFENLYVECFRDHCFWRRNFHPDDREWVRESDKIGVEFVSTQAKLRDGLNRLIAELKRCSPTFHFRYLGHMHTDLQVAGVLGQLAALFYSQNNVVAEASPVTARLEARAIGRIGTMLGYSEHNGIKPWGNICSGGTAANIQAIWVARNVRLAPVSLFLKLKEFQKAPQKLPVGLVDILVELSVEYAGARKRIVDLTTFELLNIPRSEILAMRDQIAGISLSFFESPEGAAFPTPKDLRSYAFEIADTLLRSMSPVEVGTSYVDEALASYGLKPISRFPWKLIVASTKHYSIEKIADLLGLGRMSVVSVPIEHDFSIDISELEKTMNQFATDKREGHRPIPLAIIPIMGTTEEGAVDSLPEILRVCEQFRSRGLETWIHADAAYGGYAAAMLRKSEGEEEASTPITYFTRLAGKDMGDDPYIANWGETIRRLNGMGKCDSITVDPHKMGLQPYPAGAIVFHDSRSKSAVSCEAPYLFDSEDVEAFPGRYTLEGSRPGHVAAGIHLAHEVLELDQYGHGAMIGRSMLAARQLHRELPEIIQAENSNVSIHFPVRPALNILNFILTHREVSTLKEQNILTDLILEEFSADKDRTRPISDFSFFFVSTGLPLRKYQKVLPPLFDAAAIKVEDRETETESLRMFRSVIMHPHLLGATTRINGETTPIIDVLGRRLAQVCNEKVKEIAKQRCRNLRDAFTRPPRIMIVEDEERQIGMIRNLLLGQLESYEPIVAQSEEKARQIIENAFEQKQVIDLLICDLNLQGDDHIPASKGSGNSVIRKFREAFGPARPILAMSVFSGLSMEERKEVEADRLFDKAKFVSSQPAGDASDLTEAEREFISTVTSMLEDLVRQGESLRLSAI